MERTEMNNSYSAAYADDPSGSYTTRHSLGAYRTSELMTTGNFLRFVGIPTFLKAPLLEQSKGARYGLVGIPYDGGVVRTPGARFGPRGIRAACWRAPDYHPQFDIALTECKTLVDCGDMQISPMSVADSLQTIDNCISSLLERGILPISVGGDHGITYPILRAINRMHGKVAVVHFDAHCDMQRGGFTHGTMFRYAVEEGLVSPGDFIQVGIRKIYGDDKFNFHKQHGIEVILADELDSLTETDLARRFARLKGKKVYVTYDMDFVDQAHAPGTGSPEAGGPTSTKALACVRALRGLDVVGMDLTEVAPVYDVREMTCYLANLILFEMAAVLLDAERSKHVSDTAKAQ
jgi:agmatinase